MEIPGALPWPVSLQTPPHRHKHQIHLQEAKTNLKFASKVITSCVLVKYFVFAVCINLQDARVPLP
ncbi:MAG: hypothetical protein IPJ73_08435 [Zoogloea sp.]|nr:hypothetical protein [Zoogloea sp.]